MTAGRLLVDTDVVVDYLRGVPLAVDYLERATETLLISATAELQNARLVTLNVNYFPMLTNVLVPYRKAAGP